MNAPAPVRADETPAPPVAPSPRRGLQLAVVALVVAPPVFFWMFTGNIWEDFFITYRCSLNLVHGHGLVFEAGRPVHAFTSPLGTLVPAIIAAVLGNDDPVTVMNVFRVLGCVALAAAWLVARPGRSLGAAGVAALFWAFDVKVAAYSTNGMETAFLIFATVLAWRALMDRRPRLAGFALGLALWTRPDAIVYVGVLTVATFGLGGLRGWRLRDWLVMALVTTVVYAPWFCWAWSYYGSPIPNTILAKATHVTAVESLKVVASYPFRYLFGHSAAHDAFLPPYFFFGPWPTWLPWFGHGLCLLIAAVVCWPRCDRAARIAGATFVLGGVYLTITTRAPWYFPAWTVFGYIALGGGVAAAWGAARERRALRWVLAGGVAGLLAAQVWLFVAVSVQLRAQQRLIEWGVRAPLGRALGQSAGSPAETVFLEPLGYIGFYSNLAMRDTPGLCAPEVVRLRKQGVLAQPALIAALRPDWVVLRASEFVALSPEERAGFEANYFLAAAHDVRPQVNAIAWLPGREFLLNDAYFTVWHRRGPAAISP